MPSPTIDRALMQHLAELARLHLAADRLPVLRERLERIVAAFAALGDADAPQATPGTAPAGATATAPATATTTAAAPPRPDAIAPDLTAPDLTAPPAPAAAADGPRLPLRADVAAEPLPLDVVLANAPQHAGGAFVVPRVIDA